MRLIQPILLAVVLAPIGCAGPRIGDEARIAAAPTDYVGQAVTICGYFHNAFEDSQIWSSRSSYRRGGKAMLGLLSSNDGLHDRTTCLRGELVRTGCGEEVICLYSNAPFALRDNSE